MARHDPATGPPVSPSSVYPSSTRRPEILSPGGDPEKLRTAVLYGADAVYCAGPSYGLRAHSGNLTLDELHEAVRFAHAHNVAVYVTVNIYPRYDDMDGLPDYLARLHTLGVDAILVADPGVFAAARDAAPDLPIHISTQANVTHAAAARFWYAQGARRIVLARELNLDEIRAIRREVPEDLELEAFVHGAMCLAYSGRCLLSAYMTGRDANRGACTQPCRWSYTLTERGRPDDPLRLEEDARGAYFLNSRDLCMVEHIPALMEAGISSFKIEGRMKGLLYAGLTARAYRRAVDLYLEDPATYRTPPEALDDLERLVHRRYGTGFYFAEPGEALNPTQDPEDAVQLAPEGGYLRPSRFVGKVLAAKAGPTGDRLIIEQRGKIHRDTPLSLLDPAGPNRSWRAEDLRDADGTPVPSTPHPRMTYSIRYPDDLPPGTLIRTDEPVNP